MRLRSFYLAAVYFTSLAIHRHAESTHLPATIENDASLEVVTHKTYNVDEDFSLLIDVACHKMERLCRNSTKFANRRSRDAEFSLRFMDEIAGEIDIIEDKKDTIFSRDRLKKIFIPMLLILKLFKLKLLLLLPFLLGLASFKKIIGFLIIIIPAVLGFLKLQSLQQTNHVDYHSGGLHMQYSPQGIGGLSYYPHHPQNFLRKSDTFRPDDYKPRRPPHLPDYNTSTDHRYPDSYLAIAGNRVPSARSRLTR
ncbi:uncharacterized protein LOC132257875 [Phlebotomus argentipes]|uniref:uncharacterized protein LOC132257875 n=1 Tax=Phlebotomus argentipes TaxID=94469 RepID=UPI002892C5AA|nr:uncharacterized protein LOC132257875 [Phlebotomus argentipes]